MDRFGEAYLRTQRRWHWAEACFWIAVAAAWFVFPDNLVLGTQILIAALFALSLDLVMGYAGIVTLGHAAFFGIAAYAAARPAGCATSTSTSFPTHPTISDLTAAR